MDHRVQICQSFALASGSYGHQIPMLHANGNGLHLNWLGPLELNFSQILQESITGPFYLLPLPNRMRCFPSPDVNLVIFPENPPVSLLHFLKRFSLPSLIMIVLENIFLFGIDLLLSQNRHIALTCILTFVPLK